MHSSRLCRLLVHLLLTYYYAGRHLPAAQLCVYACACTYIPGVIFQPPSGDVAFALIGGKSVLLLLPTTAPATAHYCTAYCSRPTTLPRTAHYVTTHHAYLPIHPSIFLSIHPSINPSIQVRIGEGWPVEISNSWSSPTWVVRILQNENVPYAWCAPQ